MSHEAEQDQNVLFPHLYYLQLFSKPGVLQTPLDQMVPVQKANTNHIHEKQKQPCNTVVTCTHQYDIISFLQNSCFIYAY
jgi:hypothetical protein